MHNQLLTAINEELARIIDNAGDCIADDSKERAITIVEPLYSAIKHAQFPAGKLIRPLLALSFCCDLKGDNVQLLPVASALELLHTSSLIHDDLPAMDDDDMRRGRPSCHKAFGEATAILAGDYLVGLAHHVIVTSNYSPQTRCLFVESLSKTYLKLCNGQQLDLLGSKEKAAILEIHSLKTAALFGTALLFGGIGAGLDAKLLKKVETLGISLGLCFQIIDDYLDLKSDEKGRQGGSDQKNNKTTFLNVESLDGLKDQLLNNKRELLSLFSELALLHGLSKDPHQAFTHTMPIVDSVFSKVDL